MVNISLTSASEALLQQLVEGSGVEASVVIEQALRYFAIAR
jgi:hypothetical protein